MVKQSVVYCFQLVIKIKRGRGLNKFHASKRGGGYSRLGRGPNGGFTVIY